MRSLVFWGGGRTELARGRHLEGATILLWNEAAGESLRAAQVPFVPATSHLGEQATVWIEAALRAWVQAFPHAILRDGRSFADLASWKGESLAWCAEPFFLRSGDSPRCVRLIETFHLLLSSEKPDEVEAVGLARDEAVLLGRLCTAQRILFHGPGVAVGPPGRGGTALGQTVGRVLSSLRGTVLAPKEPAPPPRLEERAAPVLWLVDEDPPAAPPERAEAEPPPLRVEVDRYSRPFVDSEVRRASATFKELWWGLRASPGLHEAFRQRGVPFADLGGGDLAELLLVEAPRAVRRYEEVAATLRALSPRLVLLRHEDRAAQGACRTASVSFVFFRSRRAAAPPPTEPAEGERGKVLGS